MKDVFAFAVVVTLIVLSMHVPVEWFASSNLGRLISIVAIWSAARVHFAAGIAVALLWVLACHPDIRKSVHDALQPDDPFVELVERHRQA